MVDYDFSTLNDKEFEDITLELISRDRNKKYQRFKQGRDGGIDGIFFEDYYKEEIVQCKHFLKSGYSQLISKLKKEEVEKVKKLAPSKYIFITSLPLSKANVDEIYNLFNPFIRDKRDIYYQEKLNDILKDNKDIEERNYKLWLNSTTVLSRILNNAIKGRSQFLIEDIQENSNKYVFTKNHKNAIEMLEKNKVLILSGEPGIGKTTLANFISLSYIHEGFEFIVIENSLNEAESIFDNEKKQLFYFDDFLGATYLEALNNKDSHVVNFIKRVARSNNKRFILTTRTIIFNQALSLSDIFLTNNIENKEYILKVKTLDNYEKALILYNHIYFSKLNEEFINEIYKEKRYLNIIRHRNFNPRLIEFITCKDRMSYTSKEDYWTELYSKIENPYDIWEQTFDKQIDEYARLIVRLVVFNRNEIDEEELKSSYQKAIKLENLTNYSYSSKEFNSIIKQVVKYFLNRIRNKDGSIIYTLFNPSIADYIRNRYKNDDLKLINTFKALSNMSSLSLLMDSYNNKYIKQVTYSKIIIELYNNIPYQYKNTQLSYNIIDYSIYVIYQIHELKIKNSNKIIEEDFFKELINKPINFHSIDKFLYLLEIKIIDKDIEIKDFTFVESYISFCSDDLDNLSTIINFIKTFNLMSTDIIFELEHSINYYLKLTLYQRMNDLNSHDVEFDEGYFGEDVSLYTDLEENCDLILDELIDEIEIFEEINLDYSYIKSNINLQEIEDKLLDDYFQDKHDFESYQRIENTDMPSNRERSIDDLFERQ